MSEVIEVKVPDIGDFKNIPVIEVLVKPGDTRQAGRPARHAGVRQGDDGGAGARGRRGEGAEGQGRRQGVGGRAGADAGSGDGAAPQPPAEASRRPRRSAPAAAAAASRSCRTGRGASARAGSAHRPPQPAPRRCRRRQWTRRASRARTRAPRCAASRASSASISASVKGSGPKERILKEDVQNYVKAELARPRGAEGGGLGFNLPPLPQVDFAKFGAGRRRSRSRASRRSRAPILHRNWVTIPHVTQHDEADITELEAFRKIAGRGGEEAGHPVHACSRFLMKAVGGGAAAASRVQCVARRPTARAWSSSSTSTSASRWTRRTAWWCR